MTDIDELVEELRAEDFRHEMQHLRSSVEIDRLFQQSADTIERLSARLERAEAALEPFALTDQEIDRLRDALREIIDMTDNCAGVSRNPDSLPMMVMDRALTALAPISPAQRSKMMPSETWKLLNDVRMFIEREYADPAVAPDGEWLAKEARPIHDRLCAALARTVEAEPVAADRALAERIARPLDDIHVGSVMTDDIRYCFEDDDVEDVCQNLADQSQEIERLRARVAELERERDEALDRECSAIVGEIDATNRAEAAESRLASQERAPVVTEGEWSKCATEGCDNASSVYFQRGGIGSHYCGACSQNIAAAILAEANGGGDD